MTTTRVIYNLVIWEDKKGEDPELKDELRTIGNTLKQYGITKMEILQVIDLDATKIAAKKAQEKKQQEITSE